MAKTDPVLTRLRRICLALPDTKETITWGKPHFRVGEKIFCGYGEEQGKAVIGFKLEKPQAELLVSGDGGGGTYWRAPYVGHHGWVSMDAGRIDDWDQVRAFVEESHRLISGCRPARKASTRKRVAPAARARKSTKAGSSAKR